MTEESIVELDSDARDEAILRVISQHDPMKPKSVVRFCQDNIVFMQFGNDCWNNFDYFPVTDRRRHTAAARLEAHTEAFRQEWADDLFKQPRVRTVFNHGSGGDSLPRADRARMRIDRRAPHRRAPLEIPALNQHIHAGETAQNSAQTIRLRPDWDSAA